MQAQVNITDRRKTRQNLFGFGRKPAPVVKPRKGRGGLSLTEAGSAAFKAGKKSRDLSDFDSWLEGKHLDTRSDGFVSRVRDDYKRGVERADADEANKEFLKQKREDARELARDRKAQARESGKGMAPGASKMPDEAALQAGFKRGLTLNEILALNPALRKSRKANPAKFDRCVKEVQAKGGDVNAYAVCTSAGTRRANPSDWEAGNAVVGRSKTDQARALKQHIKYVERDERHGRKLSKSELSILKQRFRKAAKRQNPASAAAEVFEEFHGFEPSEVVTVTKHIHHHEHLAAAGKLTHLDVWGVDGKGHHVSGFKGAFLAFNESKDQLFVEGGDQSVNLEDFGIRKAHELETLGRLTDIGYQTNKTHLGDEGGEAVYVHKFRSTNQNGKHVIVKIARYPDLIYDVRNEQLLFSGGSYEILREGINK